MSSLERPTVGYVMRAFGALFVVFAVVWAPLVIWVAHQPLLALYCIWYAACGVFCWMMGTHSIRRAREHHEFMEKHRAAMAGYAREAAFFDQKGKAGLS